MLINEQISPKLVANPNSSLPSISVSELVQLMRVDNTLGADRLAGYISDAYDMINRQLTIDCIVSNYLQAQPYQQENWQRTYKRAVLNEATALIADNYADFDSTGQGVIRGDNVASKSDNLRRVVNHCIADLTGRKRNRIGLL